MQLRFLGLLWYLLAGSELVAQPRSPGPWQVDSCGRRHRVPWTVPSQVITLFLACENPLLVPLSPAKHAALRFTATGATLRLDAPAHLLLLAPFKSVVVLRAYRGQQLVGQRTFHAVLPPLPDIMTLTGGPSSSEYKPSADQHFTLTVRALATPAFAEFFPQDARYRVARFRTTLRRAGQVVGTPALWQRDARLANLTPGEELQVDILQVQRQNFRAAVLEVPLEKQVVIPYDRW